MMAKKVVNFVNCSFLIALLAVVACKQRAFNESDTLDLSIPPVEFVDFERQKLLSEFRFARVSPTGEKIFAAAREWENLQEALAFVYAQPGQSANNVSRVLQMAGLSDYDAPLPSSMFEKVKRKGGLVIQLPNNSQSTARLIEDHFEGALPVGAMIAFCVGRDCAGEQGEIQIGIVGHIDDSHAVHLWHNNWFRPENRLWRKHMIPLAWYQAGFPRKWMSTPWILRNFDSQGKLSDLEAAVSDMSELDPSNSSMTLVILPEIVKELQAHQSVMTDGLGAVMPFRPRSVSRPHQLVVLPPETPVPICKSLKAAFSSTTHLRGKPRGDVLCQIAQGTLVELISAGQSWSHVSALCPDGRKRDGYVLSAFIVPSCGK